jgi:hypothetical protein
MPEPQGQGSRLVKGLLGVRSPLTAADAEVEYPNQEKAGWPVIAVLSIAGNASLIPAYILLSRCVVA